MVSSRRSEGYFIEMVHPSYGPLLPLITQSVKHKYNLIYNNKYWPIIMSYPECFYKVSVWKFHVILFMEPK